jgi:mannose-1-phosphate guanylyltransferase
MDRLRGLVPARNCWVVSGRELASVTRKALRRYRGVHVLLEPMARNTAAAIAWAAATVAGKDPEAVVGVFPADHHIPEPARFLRTIRTAARAAASGESLVLVGIEPSHPDTAYGYLRVDSPGSRGAVRVRRFVEKPDLARARRFAKSGRYLWNAGIVVGTARRILAETRAHSPEVWPALGGVLETLAAGRRVPAARLASAFRRVTPISFDHAVLERSRHVLAVRGRFRWSDLGSWDALGDHLPADSGNRVRGTRPVALLDASGNVIWNTTGKALALLGVENLVIVETQDALLVCSKERAQDVRRIVDELTRQRRTDLT